MQKQNHNIMNKALSFLLAMLGIHATTACSQNGFQDADVDAFSVLISQPDVQLVDVRTADEFEEGHIEGAQNIDVNQNTFAQEAEDKLYKDKPVAVYCRSGRRSAKAANILTEKGFTVTNLLGGIIAWRNNNMPTTQNLYEMDVFKTKSGKTVRFFALMHASIRIEYDGMEIAIDPVRQLGNRQIDYTAMPKADIIFVTHEHMDHFDQEAIKLL